MASALFTLKLGVVALTDGILFAPQPVPLALILANEFRDEIGIEKTVAQAIEHCVFEVVAMHGQAVVAGATVANIGAAILVCVDEDEAAATDNTLEDY